LSGRWAGEWTLNQETIHQGQRVLESRRGSTGVQLNPWFAIGKADAEEEHGETWFGALAWSGSWRITVEQDALDKVRVTGGFNPFDFGYPLKPGEKLESPVFYAGYTDHGMGGASRLLSRFTLTHILPQAPSPKLRPVIYNSLEATEWNVSEAVQEALAEKAAALGVDRFVMDDGWFGQRKNDHAGLGDWYVNKEKFPNGLKPLIDRVHSLNMDFGMWVEPKMVNPDSDLYRNHPDWVLNFPGRPRSEERNQLVLNLARPDVRKYVFDAMDKLLSENDIAFLKWDYNRNWSEPGWDQLPKRAKESLCRVHAEPVFDPGRAASQASGSGDRKLLGRGRTRRPGHSALHRRGVALGQYRSAGPADAAGWFYPCLSGPDDGGLGHRLAALAQRPHDLNDLSHAGFDAGSAGDWRQPEQLDQRRSGNCQAYDRGLSPGAEDDHAGRFVPAHIPHQWQRILRHRDRLSRQVTGCFFLPLCTRHRRGAVFRACSCWGWIPVRPTHSAASKATQGREHRQRALARGG
jgi:hypothetical protein